MKGLPFLDCERRHQDRYSRQSRDRRDIGLITDQTDKHWSKPRKPPTIEALTVKPDGEVALIAFHSPREGA